ncbi:MAG: hypothetical protein ACOY3V_08340 [Pseudomonadota bacterium]
MSHLLVVAALALPLYAAKPKADSNVKRVDPTDILPSDGAQNDKSKSTFATRFRPSVTGLVPVVLPMGDLGNVLGLGLGFSAGGSLSLNGFNFLSGLSKKNLRLDAGLLLGFYTYKTKSSSETTGTAMVLPGQFFLRIGYLAKVSGRVLEPFVFLGGGAAYVKTDRSATTGVTANTETSFDAHIAPGLGVRYEITPKIGVVFLTTYEIFFEQVSGSFLNIRLGMDYVF